MYELSYCVRIILFPVVIERKLARKDLQRLFIMLLRYDLHDH
jgi:hypothetical protein